MNLPCLFKKCPGSLDFTLLVFVVEREEVNSIYAFPYLLSVGGITYTLFSSQKIEC